MMFNNKSKPTNQMEDKRPAAPRDVNSTYTRIGEGVKIEGEIKCDGDVRIDGNVEGNIITSARVILGTKGRVLGNINCESAEIDGKFNGEITVKNLLSVTQNADLEGDVVTGRLSITDPKNFNVKSCKMQNANTPAPSAATATTAAAASVKK